MPSLMVGSVAGRAEQARGSAWFLLGILFFGAILSYTDRQVINLLVDPMRQAFSMSDLQISLIQGAAFAVVYSLVGLPMGRCADRFNRRNLILGGITVWSIATAACGLAGNLTQLVLARMCVGVGEAALFPAGVSLVHDIFPERQRGTALGILMTGMVMGAGAATVVGGRLLDWFTTAAATHGPSIGHLAPWREVLLAAAAPGVVLAALLLGFREPVRRQVQLGRPVVTFAQTMGYLFTHRRAVGTLLLAIALAAMADFAISAWLPALLMRVHHLTPGQVGNDVGVILILFSVAGTLLGGYISDALGRAGRDDSRLIPVIGAFALAVPLMLLPLVRNSHVLLGMYALYTLLTSLAGTSGITALLEVVPDSIRGFTTSLVSFLNTAIGLGLGPSLVGFTSDYVLHDTAVDGRSIVVVAIPTLVAALLLLLVALPAYGRLRAALHSTRSNSY